MTRKSPRNLCCGGIENATLHLCGSGDAARVTVANMSWQSSRGAGGGRQMVLEEGYGCKVEIVHGDTMPTLTSMMEKRASPTWRLSVDQLGARTAGRGGKEKGRLHYAAKSLPDGEVEG